MKIMFIDESGDHNLIPEKVDSNYPIFVLAGCIFDEIYYRNNFIPAFNLLKNKFFGTDSIILHTLEMTRPSKSKEPAFNLFSDAKFRNSFYEELNELVADTNFTLVACIIHKNKHIKKYGLQALDPYLLSFDNLLNRLVFSLPNNETARIIAERRNGILDNQLELAWLNAKISGTRLIKASVIKDTIDNLQLSPKSSNEPGLQFADLLVSPIGRKYMNKKSKPGHEIDFSVLQKKFRQKDGKILGYGVTILPNK